MSRFKTNQKILEAACKNSEAITDILKELDALIPPESKGKAETLWTELQHRMFYQVYLYDSHRPFGPGHKVELDYNKFNEQIGLW